MRGLLEKDFRIVGKRKMIFIIALIIAVFFSFNSKDPSLIMGYLTFMVTLVGLSTLSYDEFDNGYSFIFTLPITRKLYVVEKYLFSVLLGVMSIVAGIAILFIGQSIVGNDFQLPQYLSVLLQILTFLFILSSVMIPTLLKFGQERSRMVLFLITGVFIALIFILSSYAKNLLEGIGETLLKAPSGAIIATEVVLMAAFMLISMFISIRIMEKKEF